ncbi:2-isopropylmalate synthase, partial [Francisella tularensis subsp. holarctica]|nr:2-isopropylmalate synthase [Francisella tularensis subsp. holarctica]
YICDDKEKAAIAQQIKYIYHERRKGITDEELIHAYKQIKSPIHVSDIDYGKSNGETYVELKGRFFGNTDYRITDRGENSA